MGNKSKQWTHLGIAEQLWAYWNPSLTVFSFKQKRELATSIRRAARGLNFSDNETENAEAVHPAAYPIAVLH